MKLTLILALSCAMTCSVFAQTQDGETKPKAQHKGSSKSVFPSEIQELKDAVAAQQEQIKQLQQQIQTRDQAIEQLQNEVKNIPTPAAPPAPTDYGSDINTLQGDVKDLKATDANMAETLTETQKRLGELETPTAIHYKGITLTPGGFMAGETVWRQRATFSDINTNMNGTPFSAAGQAHQGEFYGSGRQSRISMLMQGKLANMNLTGYYELDFLSAGTTSNNNQSNSYTMRQRQAYAQAALHNGWTFTAGQMWSLVMETRKGLDNRTEATPLQIDAQYVAGMSWARQYGFRVTKNINNKTWLGFSIEDPQTNSLGVSGANVNFLIGGPGAGGGLFNPLANYSSNISPDFILKAAFEPSFGGHYEIFGVLSNFRERVYPNAIVGGTNTAAGAVGAYNRDMRTGGFGANARWLFAHKKVETGLHFMTGNAVGRYGNTGLPDVTVYGNGVEHPLRSYQLLAEVDYHTQKWDWYFDVGGEYVGKNWAPFLNPVTNKISAVGYGSPWFNNTGCGTEVSPVGTVAGTSNFNNGFPANIGNGIPAANPGLNGCTGQTQSIIEGTIGFWYKPYNGPKGRLQIGVQYSYLTRNAWSGYGAPPYSFPLPPAVQSSGTVDPRAVNNMVFTSFRYYLP